MNRETENRRSNGRIRMLITSIILCLAILTIGIWAATQVDVTGNGTLNFSALDVFATVKIEETLPGQTATTVLAAEDATFDENTSGEPATKTVTLGNAVFTKADNVLTYTITITNTSEDGKTIVATPAASVSGDSASLFTVAVKSGDTDITSLEIASESSAVITVTVTLDSFKQTVQDAPLTLNLTLVNKA